MLLSRFITILEDDLARGFASRMRYTRNGPVADFAFPDDLNRLNAEEAAHRKAVDVAITYWIAHRRWPLASPIIAEYCMVRLLIAIRLLKALAPLQLNSGASEDAVLLWLLVRYWRASGLAYWRAKAGLTSPPTS